MVAWVIAAAVCAGGDPTRAESARGMTANQPLVRVAADPASLPSTDRPAATSGVGQETDQRSRGVARRLLLAGIGAAVVIAVLSGAFALRHKKEPGAGGNSSPPNIQ